MIDILILAAALAQQAQPPSQPPSTGIAFLARTSYANGKSEFRELKTIVSPLGSQFADHTFYVTTKGPVCAGLVISDHAPAAGAQGWRVHVGRVKYAPAARVVTKAEVMVTAQRLGSTSASDVKMAALPTQAAQRSADIDMATGLRPENGCNAVALTLQARLLPDPTEIEVSAEEPARRQLVEAELWFVHKAPDGKETSQRQVLRLRKHNTTEFYFDDIEVATRWFEQDIRLTVEVFGALTIDEPKDGEVGLLLNLTRRYLTKQFLMGSWPKSGTTQLPTSATMGEVVSFVLPPLQDDAGVFLGHRFSVRVRFKPLGPE